MTNEEFSTFVDDELSIIMGTIFKKGEEYSKHKNRFSNFYAMADFQDIKPEEAWRGVWSKHAVSISDYVFRSVHGERFSKKQWREKLHDNIIYSLLMLGLLEDLGLYDEQVG